MKKYMIRSIPNSWHISGSLDYTTEYAVFENRAKYWFQFPQWYHVKGFASLAEATTYITALAIPEVYFDERGKVL